MLIESIIYIAILVVKANSFEQTESRSRRGNSSAFVAHRQILLINQFDYYIKPSFVD